MVHWIDFLTQERKSKHKRILEALRLPGCGEGRFQSQYEATTELLNLRFIQPNLSQTQGFVDALKCKAPQLQLARRRKMERDLYNLLKESSTCSNSPPRRTPLPKLRRRLHRR